MDQGSGFDGCGFRALREGEQELINGILFAEYGADYPAPFAKGVALSPESVYVAGEQSAHGVIAFGRATWRPGPDLYEIGAIITDARRRQRGIATALTARCVEGVRRRGGDRVFAEPVCHHLGSQKLFEALGFRQTALSPAKYPGILRARLGGQPESVTMTFTRLNGPVDEGRALNLPSDYQELFEGFFGREAEKGELYYDELPEPIYSVPLEKSGVRGSAFLRVAANFQGSRAAIRRARNEGFVLAGFIPAHRRLSDGRRADDVLLFKPSAKIDFGLVRVLPGMSPLLTHIQRELVA